MFSTGRLMLWYVLSLSVTTVLAVVNISLAELLSERVLLLFMKLDGAAVVL